MVNKSNLLVIKDSQASPDIKKLFEQEIEKGEYTVTETADPAMAVQILRDRIGTISLIIIDFDAKTFNGAELIKTINVVKGKEPIPVMVILDNDDTFRSFSDFFTDHDVEHMNVEREIAEAILEETVDDEVTQESLAYSLGAVDTLIRSSNNQIAYKRRIENNLLLNQNNKKLEKIISDRIVEKLHTEKLMIAILSHIVEFRNGESGRHVINIQIITRMILEALNRRALEKNGKERFDEEQIEVITNASSLHDIGKIYIPDHILNKPGRFTPEEFAVMKTHSEKGGEALENLPIPNEEPLVKYALEICWSHHERYDGKGYPKGKQGNEIPITAQVVALADVYDALTSERCYKKAFTHEKAVSMILNGECGTFSPEILDCLREVEGSLKDQLQENNAMATFFRASYSGIYQEETGKDGRH